MKKIPAGSKEGDPAWVVIPSRTDQKGLSVPEEAVAYAGDKAGVFVVVGPGAFRLQPVITSGTSGGRTHITSGITSGDTIALSGAWLMYGELHNKLGKSPLQVFQNEH